MITGADLDVVLLVEDDERHAELFQMAWQEMHLPGTVVVVPNADATFVFIEAAWRTLPPIVLRLIMLDLNLPGRDGRDILRDLRHDHRLDDVPVVVLSTSPAQTDIDLAAKLGADDYVIRPLTYRQLAAEITKVATTWLHTRPLSGSPS